MKPSERAVEGILPDQDVVDAALIIHGARATVYPVAFHNILRGDKLILGDFCLALQGRGPCADVAATNGTSGAIRTRGGLTVMVSDPGAGIPYIWVVEEEERCAS